MFCRVSASSYASSVPRKVVHLQCALKSDYYTAHYFIQSSALVLLLHVHVILVSLKESFNGLSCYFRLFAVY